MMNRSSAHGVDQHLAVGLEAADL